MYKPKTQMLSDDELFADSDSDSSGVTNVDNKRKVYKRHRGVKITCNWGYVDLKNNEKCNKKEYAKGFCLEHYYKLFRVTPKKCRECSWKADAYGDGFCTVCAKELKARPQCQHEGCENFKWSKREKIKYCNRHDENRQCRVKTCNGIATKEHYGFRYCRNHYPERKTCKHVTYGKRCRRIWYGNMDFGDNGFCFKHNLSGIDRCTVNNVTRKKKKFSGRCSKIIDLDKAYKCQKSATVTGYCIKHNEEYINDDPYDVIKK